MTYGKCTARRSWARQALMMAWVVCLAAIASGAQAAGKPEKAMLEGKLHLIWNGLQSPELSRFTASQLYNEHVRDVRALPGLLRYNQSVPLPIYDLRSTYDSVSEFYLDDFSSMKAAFEGPENRVGADQWMLRFVGRGVQPRPWRPAGSGGVIVKDHVIVDGYEWGYKWFNFMRRKEGVSKEQADAYMRDVYAPAIAKLPGVRRYVLGQSYIPKGADGYWGRPPIWDSVDMIWFDNLEDMKRFLGSLDYQENVLRPAEVAVMDQSKTVSFATKFNDRVPFPPRYQGPKWEEFKPATPGK